VEAFINDNLGSLVESGLIVQKFAGKSRRFLKKAVNIESPGGIS
jgi:hypothetical protein